MKIEERDKKALMYGGAAVLAILIVGFGVIPMVRSWSSSGSSLTSDGASVETLRESVRSQAATLEQRNALVLRMGSLFGPLATPQAKGEKKPPETPPAAAGPPPPQEGGAPQETPKPGPEGKPAPEAAPAPKTEGAGKPVPTEADKAEPGKPEPPKDEQPKAEAPKPGGAKDQTPKAAAPGSNTLAGYVEQNAKKAGATVKRITPKKNATVLSKVKRFHPITLQVSIECSLQNLVGLLKALEKGERFVKVDQFQLKRDLAGGDKIEVTMDLHSYEAVAS